MLKYLRFWFVELAGRLYAWRHRGVIAARRRWTVEVCFNHQTLLPVRYLPNGRVVFEDTATGIEFEAGSYAEAQRAFRYLRLEWPQEAERMD